MRVLLTLCIATSMLDQLLNAAAIHSRAASACVVVQGSIYCYGGYNTEGHIMSDTWSLSVENDFTLNSSSWTRVTHSNEFTTTPTAFGVIVGLNDNVSFLVNGGMSMPYNSSEINQTTVFNTESKTWSSINSSSIIQTRQHQVVVDTTGRIWMWGGVSDSETGYNNVSYWGGMSYLTQTNWQWNSQYGDPSIDARVGHTMTLTTSGILYIIGGLIATQSSTLDSQNYTQWTLNDASMSEIPQYNTYNGQWASVTASGAIPSVRNIHTATLAPDGKTIIVFGGMTGNRAKMYNDLYTFDTSKSLWTNISAYDGPSRRAGHSAVQVNNTMFIMFGYDFTWTTLSDIYALDTVNWRWVTQFNAAGYQFLNNTSTDPSHTVLTTGQIIGIAISAAVVLIGIGALLFWFLGRKRNNKLYKEDNTNTHRTLIHGEPLLLPSQYYNSPDEVMYNTGRKSEYQDYHYGQNYFQEHQSHPGSNGPGCVAMTQTTNSTPPDNLSSTPANINGNMFVSKPDANDVPHTNDIPHALLRELPQHESFKPDDGA